MQLCSVLCFLLCVSASYAQEVAQSAGSAKTTINWSAEFSPSAVATTELKRRQGLVLIDTETYRRVSAWRLGTDLPTIRPQQGRRFALLTLPTGSYHWQNIDVPYFDLPYQRTLNREPQWGFQVKPGVLNYFGSLQVGKARGRASVDVRLLNRSAEVLKLLSEEHSHLLTKFPFVYSGNTPDEFTNEYATSMPAHSSRASLTASSAEDQAHRAALFDRTRRQNFKLSPDGYRLAYILRESIAGVSDPSEPNLKQHLEVIDVRSGQIVRLLDIAEELSLEASIAQLRWIDNERLFVLIGERTSGIADLQDTRANTHRLVVNAVNSDEPVRFIQTGGQFVGSLTDEPERLLYAVSGSTSYVYKVDTAQLNRWKQPLGKTSRVDGGAFSRVNRLTEVSGYAFNWLTDPDGTVGTVVYWDPDEGLILAQRNDNAAPWKTLKTWREEKRKKGKKVKKDRSAQLAADLESADFRLLASIPQSNDFVVMSEGENGRESVYRLQVADDKKTLIYEHPTAQVLGVTYDHSQAQLLSINYFEDGYLRQHYLQEGSSQLGAMLDREFPNQEAFVVSTDRDSSSYAAIVHSATSPGRMVVVQPEQNLVTDLGAIAPLHNADAPGQFSAHKVQSEGLDVEYFVHLPQSRSPAPLIVMPHGGPIGVLDQLTYNPDVQYLNAQGYAVLQVNFRGSAGYGSKFSDAGKGEFGRLMLADIEAALAQVVGNNRIDSSRMCVVGGSYGGYAALMMALREPERFDCVVTMAGVSDLGLLLGEHVEETRDYLLEMFLGEGVALDNHKRLMDLSPVYQLESLVAPVLIAHGSKDRIVDIEHAHRLRARLDALKKPYIWEEYVDEGHSFSSGSARFEYMKSVGRFLQQNLR